jgi:hypothetical protein
VVILYEIFDRVVAYLAGVGAGRTPEIIEMKQVGVSRNSGSARGSSGGKHVCNKQD